MVKKICNTIQSSEINIWVFRILVSRGVAGDNEGTFQKTLQIAAAAFSEVVC